MKRRVSLGKPIIWFPKDETEAERLAAEMATPDAETVELAKSKWKAVRDTYQLMLEAKPVDNA